MNLSATLYSTNAGTRSQCTTYEFEIVSNKLQEALDIWAHFFIDPVMSENAVEREMKAVDSEFENTKTDDDIRLDLILKESIVNSTHQMAGFGWGNIKSLKTDLEESGVTAFQLLHEWYPQNYSANWMYLTVQSGKGIILSQIYYVTITLCIKSLVGRFSNVILTNPSREGGEIPALGQLCIIFDRIVWCRGESVLKIRK